MIPSDLKGKRRQPLKKSKTSTQTSFFSITTFLQVSSFGIQDIQTVTNNDSVGSLSLFIHSIDKTSVFIFSL